ncbi:LPXTG cell wall anchor domain-containing protein [Kitasatospora purpeofusca]|uniref:LPXTG cell wall anchor domain-containing protein n=1 Tax=Kitasatospora purpeofusca TaxID=67352 RepID=UPI00225870B4|nr:LPXTG cell wall anchor domain-containing protein [Kitasatospora purpeofusca]MCX4686694.1 LPXTG cell wall anchor domain-containing protein [Kitasatospora purpeofusca]
MLAHSLTRRSRLLAAATLIAATGVTVLAPAAAFADTTPAAVAPASAAPAAKADENAAKPLAATLETAPGQAPITRGGEGATMKLTVTNNSDQEQQYHPAISVTPLGTAPTSWSWIDFSAKEISGAEESYGVQTFGNSGFTGYVLPKNAMTFRTFTVPARTTYSWSVTVKVRAALPADNTAVKLTLLNDRDNSTNSAPINLPVAAHTEALFQHFSPSDGTIKFDQPWETDISLLNNGATITSPITPTLRYPETDAVLKLDVQRPDGTWAAIVGANNTWQLPSVTGGIAKGESYHYKARLSLVSLTGTGTFFSGWLSLMPNTDQGTIDVAEGALVKVDGYRATPTPQPEPTPTATTPAPTTAPTDTPSTAPTGTPTAAPTTARPAATTTAAAPVTVPTATPTATAGTKVVAAAYNSGSQAGTTTTTATGATGTTLASTGAGNSVAMFGTAGALVLLGSGAVLYAKRRRTQTQG